MHLGKWSDPRRNALATSVLALSCQKSSTCAKCDTTLGIPSFLKFSDRCQVTNLCVAACMTSGQSMHQFKDSLLSCQPSRVVFVETQWTAQFQQKCVVLDIHHCAFGSHWREATRLVFGGQSDRACFHSLYSCRFRCHGTH